ncbi:F0F1 ATP synthase subunit B [bacterium]|nr:F0F1 ATP synthase subunit B [bacterium]
MNLNGTLLGQMIAFGLFIWFCWKFVWPPLLAAMEERANKIEQGLKDSEDSAKKIIEAEEQSKKMITEAKSEAKKVLSNAKAQSEKIVEDSKTKATEEKNRIVASAQAEIDKEVVNAKKSLEKDFAINVMSAAKKIVGKEISETNHGDTIQKSLDDFRK